mmetsp:Transcript_4603/g.6712  ORF Transcript_4603/g.6712 Transcript_4603/m.6712 type:complete len:85 (+) Transcript_4603:974-1228(+)
MCRIHEVMAELLNRMKKSLLVVSETRSMAVVRLFWIGINESGGGCGGEACCVLVLLLLMIDDDELLSSDECVILAAPSALTSAL